MLLKIEEIVASITAKVNKPLCILLGLIVGYSVHPILSPVVHVVIDIALIPLKILKVL